MPGFDKTGPQGRGPLTGGGRGNCQGGDSVGRGNGLGRGRGLGRGLGNMCRRGWRFLRDAPEEAPTQALAADSDAKDPLVKRIEELERELAAVRSQLDGSRS